MPLFLGKDGVNREIKEVYLSAGGVNKKINESYIGQGGVNKLIYQDKKEFIIPNGELVGTKEFNNINISNIKLISFRLAGYKYNIYAGGWVDGTGNITFYDYEENYIRVNYAKTWFAPRKSEDVELHQDIYNINYHTNTGTIYPIYLRQDKNVYEDGLTTINFQDKYIETARNGRKVLPAPISSLNFNIKRITMYGGSMYDGGKLLYSDICMKNFL